jgi:hypothetical protein
MAIKMPRDGAIIFADLMGELVPLNAKKRTEGEAAG